MGCVVDVELEIDDICKVCVMQEVRGMYTRITRTSMSTLISNRNETSTGLCRDTQELRSSTEGTNRGWRRLSDAQAMDQRYVKCADVGSVKLTVSVKAWRKGSIEIEEDKLVTADWMKDIACVHGKAKTPKAQKSANSMVVSPAVSQPDVV